MIVQWNQDFWIINWYEKVELFFRAKGNAAMIKSVLLEELKLSIFYIVYVS